MNKFENAIRVAEIVAGTVYNLCQMRRSEEIGRYGPYSDKTEKKVTVESVKNVGVTTHVRVNDGKQSRLLTLDNSGVGFHRRHYRKDIYWLEES